MFALARGFGLADGRRSNKRASALSSTPDVRRVSVWGRLWGEMDLGRCRRFAFRRAPGSLEFVELKKCYQLDGALDVLSSRSFNVTGC